MPSAVQTPPVFLPVQARAQDVPAALLLLADAEADALADRLHDDVLQVLVAARYATDAVARGAAPDVAREAVQEALVTLRRTVWHLRPRTASGLPAALDELSAHRQAAGLQAPVLSVDVDLARRLGPTAAAAAYRLVQAVLDRSGTAVVTGSLTSSSGRAVLELSGVVPDPAGWSLRARALGGRLVVGSDRLWLLLPLEVALPDLPDLPDLAAVPDLPDLADLAAVPDLPDLADLAAVPDLPDLTHRDLPDRDREAAS